jgi:lysophospholipase L1-like esterase
MKLLALITLLLLVLASSASADRGALSFSSEQPGDYQGDASADGIARETVPSAVDGRHWPLDVTVSPSWCVSSGKYEWTVDSRPVPSERLGSCSYELTFPQRGAYQLTLHAAVGSDSITVTQPVLIKGLLIVAIGDSVASGEGVPDLPGGIHARWQSRQCHRSARAGPSLAARAVQQQDPTTPVTFVSMACSGATVQTGLVASYDGIDQKAGEAPLPPQLDVLRQIETSRPVDALVISIGANDVRFSDVVKTCVPFLHPVHPLRARRCFDHQGTLGGITYPNVAQAVARLVNALPDGYDDVGRRLQEIGIPAQDVYLMQYFDPIAGANGAACTKGILGISATALAQARASILTVLNKAGEDAAARLHWHYVRGISDRFKGHGYCARGRDAWVVKLTKSLFREHHFVGVLHPNEEGHRRIARVLAADLEQGLPSACGVAVQACEAASEPEISDTATGLLEGGGAVVGVGLLGIFLRRNRPRWQRNRDVS